MKIGTVLKRVSYVAVPSVFDMPAGALGRLFDDVFVGEGKAFEGSLDDFAKRGEELGLPYFFVIDSMRDMASGGWITIESDRDTFMPLQPLIDRYA